MAVALNKWEKEQIETIDKLLKKAKLTNDEFIQEQIQLNEDVANGIATNSETQLPERFRYFVIDLYSVLDYLCFLCFCHFQNGGKPDYSSKSRNVKFPYTEKLRTSTNANKNDEFDMKNKKFAEKHYKIIFGSEQDRFESFKEFILDCQFFTAHNHAKNTSTQEFSVNAEYFNLLHYCRNRSCHRDLVQVSVQEGYVNRNLTTGEWASSHEIRNDPNWESLEASIGFWLHVPEFGNADGSMTLKPIVEIAPKLIDFVERARNELLSTAFDLN